MAWKPIPIVDGSYADDSRSFSAQDTVNWLPVAAEQAGARSNTMLRTPPGLQQYAQMDGPHRGARNVEGKLFIVADTNFGQLDTDGLFTILGTVPGRSRVSMTHNQITGGNEVMIVNGSAGYVYNTVTQVFAQIADSGFPGGIVCDYINSLNIFIEPGRRFFGNSGIANATDYNTIERYESEAAPDRLRSLLVSHLEVWLFNERTTEIFENTSDPASIADHILFVNKRIVIERGCAGPHTVCKLDNSVFWVGDDGSVYRADGYTPHRISTMAIERALSDCDLSKSWMTTWSDRGHKVVYLTCPDGRTWGYDIASGKWHRRESKGMNRWRLNTLVEWNGDWYGGDKDGAFYRLNWDYFMEGCDEMVSSRTSGVLHDNQNRVTVHGIELKFDTGSAVTTCDPILPLQFYQPLTVAGNFADCAVGDTF